VSELVRTEAASMAMKELCRRKAREASGESGVAGISRNCGAD
jgi:hypothetical protein